MDRDSQLLRRFAEEGSQEAFTELVRAKISLVFAAALRQTDGDVHLAEGVTQGVFLALARQARALTRHTVLTGWLFTTTRFMAIDAVRKQARWQRREQEANMKTMANEAEPAWAELRPVIDAAMHALPEKDRVALLLRFFESQPLAAVGAAVGLSENAARVRVERALDKLRENLARRGITSTAAALGGVLAAQPAVAVPAGLVAATARSAIAGSTTAAGVAAARFTFMSITKTAGGLAIVALAFLAGLWLRRDPAPAAASESPQLVADLRKENASLKDRIDQLEAERTVTLNDAAQARTKSAQIEAQWQALQAVRAEEVKAEKERAIFSNLRQLAAARDQFKVEHGSYPSPDELVGVTKYVRAINAADGEDYSQINLSGRSFAVTSPNGLTVNYDAGVAPVRGSAVKKAVVAYQAAHNGATPPRNDTGLASYFEDARDAADYLELVE